MKQCKVCGTTKKVKGYIIADDMENPQLYCKKCYEKLWIEIMTKVFPPDEYFKKPPKCFDCGKDMKPIIEKNGKKSKYSFHCDCYPNKIISIG